MSRDAVYQAIVNDPTLNDLGIDTTSVFPNFSMDQRPPVGGLFVILRWEDQSFVGKGTFAGTRRGIGSRNLTVWVHIAKTESSDFTRIDAAHDQIEKVLTELEHVPGDDNYTITCIYATGRGGDLRDDGFDTLTRNAAFSVLSRPS